MGSFRRGILSLAVAGALAAGGFIGGLMLSGTPATAAGSVTDTGARATTVAATTSPSATPKSNESAAHEKQETAAQEQAENNGTARHKCPDNGSNSSANTSSTSSNA